MAASTASSSSSSVPKRIVICSTSVGPLGSGIGGGVELTLHGLVLGLAARGHHVEVVAPAGSLHVGASVHQIPGAPQVSSQTMGREAPIEMPAAPVLGAMWEWVRDHQSRFDVAINLAYDWLPFYLTPFLRVPVAHLVSMGSLNDAMDGAIADLLDARPGAAAVHSRAQAETFPAIADRLPCRPFTKCRRRGLQRRRASLEHIGWLASSEQQGRRQGRRENRATRPESGQRQRSHLFEPRFTALLVGLHDEEARSILQARTRFGHRQPGGQRHEQRQHERKPTGWASGQHTRLLQRTRQPEEQQCVDLDRAQPHPQQMQQRKPACQQQRAKGKGRRSKTKQTHAWITPFWNNVANCGTTGWSLRRARQPPPRCSATVAIASANSA